MSTGREGRIQLGQAARRYYFDKASIDQACIDLTKNLTPGNIQKVHRNTLLTVATNEMSEWIDGQQEAHTPTGLVISGIAREQILTQTPLSIYHTLPPDWRLENLDPQMRVPNFFHFILSTYCQASADTMMMYFHQAYQTGSRTLTDLAPYNSFGNPLTLPRLGVQTDKNTMQNALETLIQLLGGDGANLGEVREYARGGKGCLVYLSKFNIVQGVNMLRAIKAANNSGSDPFVGLDPITHTMRFLHPRIDQLTQSTKLAGPHLPEITTGCPARVSIFTRKPAPIIREYERLLDRLFAFGH